MTEQPAGLRRFKATPYALGLTAALGLGVAVLYGTGLGRGNGEAAACAPARATVARLAPLARGEVAAMIVKERPAPLPALAFNGPDGRPLGLEQFRGRAVLLNLWATWCAPCRKEMPALDRLQAELVGPAFEVVAINVDTRNLVKPKAWLQDNSIAKLAYYVDA